MLPPINCLQAFELQQERQARIVDLRTPSEFGHGHPRDAISISYSPKGLSERLELVLPFGTALVFLIPTDLKIQEIENQLEFDSFSILGMLAGGFPAWCDNGLPTGLTSEIPIQQLEVFTHDEGNIIIDVREPMEWATGHIPGALLISLGNLERCIGDLPQHRGIAVVCEAGIRSSTAASILQSNHFLQVSNVIGGTGSYRRSRLPLQYPQET